MKKKILIALMILLLAGCAVKDLEISNDAIKTKDNIENKQGLFDVDLVSAYSTYSPDGTIVETYLYEYDDTGKLKSLIKKDANDNIIIEALYDEYGNIIEKIENKNGSWFATSKFDNTYDSNNNLIKIVHNVKSIYVETSYTTEMEYEYNNNGLILKRTSKDNNGVVVDEYKYDSNDNLIKCNNDEYFYDGEGHLVKKYFDYGPNEHMEGIFEYDSNGNLIKYTEGFKGSDPFCICSYEYDNKSHLTKETYYDNVAGYNTGYDVYTYKTIKTTDKNLSTNNLTFGPSGYDHIVIRYVQ